MPPSEEVLIVGADGLVAANLGLCLSDHFCVHALPLERLWPNSVRPGMLCDASDPVALHRLVQDSRPNWIVYCGQTAEASWDRCLFQSRRRNSQPHAAESVMESGAGSLDLSQRRHDPAPGGAALVRSQSLGLAPRRVLPADREIETIRALAEVADRTGAFLTVISSDGLFRGPRLWHAEDDPVDLGRSTAAARRIEAAVAGRRTLVVRTHAYGWSPAGAAPGLAERIWHAAASNEPVAFDPERYASPILATDLAELLADAWRRRLTGVYHVAGAERVSLPRFAAELAAAFGIRHFRPDLDRRPLRRPLVETALDCRRAQRDLGRPMPLLREGLARFAAQAANGYRARLRVGDLTRPLTRVAG